MASASVPRVQVHSAEDVRRILLAQRPVIITNFQSDWPSATHATGTSHSSGSGSDSGSENPFSKVNLVKRFGTNIVRVSVSESDRFDGPEDASLWGLTTRTTQGSGSGRERIYDEVLVRPPQTSMLLADFFTLVSSDSDRSDGSDNSGSTESDGSSDSGSGSGLSETFYLEYLALNQYLGQEFSDLVPLPAFVPLTNLSVSTRTHTRTTAATTTQHDRSDRDRDRSDSDGDALTAAAAAADSSELALRHLLTNLWIGGQPTTSPLHFDDYENFLTQIQGCKELILFPPSDMPYLYYVGRPKGTMVYEYPSKFIRDVQSVDTRGFVFGSSVRVDEPDFNKHPLYARAHPVRAVLSAGDTLYLPAYWHHEVQSIPTASTDTHCSSTDSDTDTNSNDSSNTVNSSESESESEGNIDSESEGMLNIAVNYWFANITASPVPLD